MHSDLGCTPTTSSVFVEVKLLLRKTPVWRSRSLVCILAVIHAGTARSHVIFVCVAIHTSSMMLRPSGLEGPTYEKSSKNCENTSLSDTRELCFVPVADCKMMRTIPALSIEPLHELSYQRASRYTPPRKARSHQGQLYFTPPNPITNRGPTQPPFSASACTTNTI